jgi:hypothetical protein
MRADMVGLRANAVPFSGTRGSGRFCQRAASHAFPDLSALSPRRAAERRVRRNAVRTLLHLLRGRVPYLRA